MALDTVAAALASPVVGRVVVVSADRAVRAAAAELGAEVILDVPDAGLNPALAYATTLVRPRGSTASLPGVAALAADLPALRPDDLTAALRAAEVGDTIRRAFVSDAAGTGTVLLAARPGVGLEPCFGAGSAAAHAASGAIGAAGRLAEPAPRRRHRGRSGRRGPARRRSAHRRDRPGRRAAAGAGPGPGPRRPGCWSTRARSACWAAEPGAGDGRHLRRADRSGLGRARRRHGGGVPGGGVRRVGAAAAATRTAGRSGPRSERPGGARHIDRSHRAGWFDSQPRVMLSPLHIHRETGMMIR